MTDPQTRARGTAAMIVACLLLGCGRHSAKSKDDSSLPPPGNPGSATSPPAPVAGSYLTVTQADGAGGTGVPSQDGLVPGDTEITFGAAIVGPDGKRVAQAPKVEAVTLALQSPAPALTLKILVLPQDPAFDFVFRLPTRVAAQVVDVSATLSGQSQVATVGTKAAQQPGKPRPFAFSVFSVTRPQGTTDGKRLIIFRGTGFAMPLAVKLDGAVACDGVQVFSSSLAGCVTPPHAAGQVDLSVTTSAGTAHVAGGYTFVPPADDPCGKPLAAVVPGNGLAYDVCDRAGWLSAVDTVNNFQKGTIRLLDNVDLGRDLNGGLGTTPAYGMHYLTQGGVLDGNGMTIANAISPDGGLLAQTNGGLVIKDLTVANPVVTSGGYAGGLVANMMNTVVHHVAIVGGSVTGATYVGGVAGAGVFVAAATVVPGKDAALPELYRIDVDSVAVSAKNAVLGGVVGAFQAHTADPIRVEGIDVDAVSTCSTSCGGLFGDLASAALPLSLTGIRVKVIQYPQPLTAGTGSSNSGGLFGQILRVSPENLPASLTILGVDVDYQLSDGVQVFLAVGGLIGSVVNFDKVAINTVRLGGTVAVKYGTAIGGLVGSMTNAQIPSPTFAATDVVSTLAINGKDSVGGLFGITYPSDVSVTGGVVAGAVSGATARLGGLAGAVNAMACDHCLVLGTVSRTDDPAAAVDALVGSGKATTKVTYWSTSANPHVAALPTANDDQATGASDAELVTDTAVGWTKSFWTSGGDALAKLAAPPAAPAP